MRIPGTIPIIITPYFWLLSGLIGWINTSNLLLTAIWIGIIFFSVLMHEFGHAITALTFGQKAHIELVSFGGVTHRHGPKLKLWKEFLIVLNGPCVSLLLSCAAYFLFLQWPSKGLLSYTLTVTFMINLFWTILNMLPVLPLDGGRLMSIVFEGILGVKGVKIALFLSIVLAVLFGIGFFITNTLLIGALFFFLAFESYRNWTSVRVMSESDQDEKIIAVMKEAESDFRGGRHEESIAKLRQVMASTGNQGLIYLKATQLLAHLLAHSGKEQEAYELLQGSKKSLEPPALLLLHQLAFSTGHFAEAIAIGNEAYQTMPHFELAAINAKACAMLSQVKPAVGWLQCAKRDGNPFMQELVRKSEFNALRKEPLFQEFVHAIDGIAGPLT